MESLSPQSSPRENLPVFGVPRTPNSGSPSVPMNFIVEVHYPTCSYSSSSMGSTISKAAVAAHRTYGSPPRTIDSDFRLKPRTSSNNKSRKRPAQSLTPPSPCSPQINLSALSIHSPKHCGLSSPSSCFTKVASSPASSVLRSKSPRTEFSSPKMVPLTVLTDDSKRTKPEKSPPRGSLLPLSLPVDSPPGPEVRKETLSGSLKTFGQRTSVLSTPRQLFSSPRPKKTPIKAPHSFLSPRSAKLTPVPKVSLTPRSTSSALPRFPSPDYSEFVSPTRSVAAPPPFLNVATASTSGSNNDNAPFQVSSASDTCSLDLSFDEDQNLRRNKGSFIPFPDWGHQPPRSVMFPSTSPDELDRMVFASDSNYLESESLSDDDEFLLAAPGMLSEERRHGRKLLRLNLEDKNHTSYTSLSSCNSLRGIKFAPSATSLGGLDGTHLEGVLKREESIASIGLTLDDGARDLVTPPLLKTVERTCPPPPLRFVGTSATDPTSP